MKIKFLQDYRGVLTGERFFEKGTTIDTSKGENKDIDGEALVNAGRAKGSGGKQKAAKPKKK